MPSVAYLCPHAGQLTARQSRRLDQRPWVVLSGWHALREKHVVDLRDGSTEIATVVQALFSNLVERGLRTDRSLLVVIDGSKARRKAVDQTCGPAARVHRCQIHKLRNVLDHLPLACRPWARAILQQAYRMGNAGEAQRSLERFAVTLERNYPCAAASLREGLVRWRGREMVLRSVLAGVREAFLSTLYFPLSTFLGDVTFIRA